MKSQGALFNNYKAFHEDNSRALNQGQDPVQLYRSQAQKVDPDSGMFTVVLALILSLNCTIVGWPLELRGLLRSIAC